MNVALAHPNQSWVELMQPAAELAKSIAGTDFVPKQMRNSPAAIAAAILYGAEVGLGPMQSLARIAVIEGKPTLAAETQRALILTAGHELWLEDSTVTRCTIAGQRRGSDQTTRVTWTMDDAKRANLAGKQNWRTYPRQMLLARASAELARTVFADAIGGLAATEELEDGGAPVVDGAPPEPDPNLQTRQRAPTSPFPAARATISAPLEPEPAPPVELPGDEDAEPTAPIDEPTRRFLHARKRALGIEDARLKELIEQITGQQSTTKIQRDQLDGLLALMETEQLEPGLELDSPFKAPPGADQAETAEETQSAIDIGHAHEDRG